MGGVALWWIAEALNVCVSFVVFAILDVVDRLLCVVFRALDSILDSETTPCYCKHRIRGALPQTYGPSLHSPANLLGNNADECGYAPSYNAVFASADRSKLVLGIEDSPSQPKHTAGHPTANEQCESLVPENVDEFVDTPSFLAECALADCPSHSEYVYGIKDGCPSQPKHNEGHLPLHAYGTGECKSLVSCNWECKSFVKPFHDNDGCPSDAMRVLHGSEGCPSLAKEVNGCQERLTPTHAHDGKRGSSLPQSNSKFLRPMISRWSDCGCSTCTSWQSDGMEHLYVHVEGQGHENVLFIHGFLSSSALWSEKVIPNLPCESRASHRLFAVDLLGFGKSPKPRSCLYTMADHIKKIEESVLHRYKIDSFHLVAHSMGCIVALALAAAHINSIKTITLVAPPYFPAPENESGAPYVLRQLAPRRIWPPLAFGASVMSWYEHVGRGLCFLLCKQHFMWEWVLSILTLNRISRFAVCDFMQHTHHSAWHIFHNVICGEAHALDGYLNILEKGSCKIHVIHGKDDSVVPAQCSYRLQKQFENLELEVLDGANHFTVIFGQEKLLAHKLQKIWRKETSNAISSRKP